MQIQWTVKAVLAAGDVFIHSDAAAAACLKAKQSSGTEMRDKKKDSSRNFKISACTIQPEKKV